MALRSAARARAAVFLAIVLLGGCGVSSGGAANSPALGGTSPTTVPTAGEVQPTATDGWVAFGYPFQALIPADWDTNNQADYGTPIFGAKTASGGVCELWDDGTAATDSPAQALADFATGTLTNLNQIPPAHWSLTSLVIPGVAAAARLSSTGADGREDFLAGLPLHTGGIGLFLLQCTPAESDGIMAAIMASLAAHV